MTYKHIPFKFGFDQRKRARDLSNQHGLPYISATWEPETTKEGQFSREMIRMTGLITFLLGQITKRDESHSFTILLIPIFFLLGLIIGYLL